MNNKLRSWLYPSAILFAGLLIYAQVAGFDFVYFDDNDYVTRNQQVSNGLTMEGLHWAFASLESKHWHPLTWVSHMLDESLFGLHPAGHHGMNVALHLLTALLLFRFLVRTTGDRGPAPVR